LYDFQPYSSNDAIIDAVSGTGRSWTVFLVYRLRTSQGCGSALIWVVGSESVFNKRIRIQEGKNDPRKKEKNKDISCFELLDVFF
jgi:hypothetical protein